MFLAFAFFISAAFFWFFFRNTPYCDTEVAIGCDMVGNCKACPFNAICEKGQMVSVLKMTNEI